jgi:hypothetical protein
VPVLEGGRPFEGNEKKKKEKKKKGQEKKRKRNNRNVGSARQSDKIN